MHLPQIHCKGTPHQIGLAHGTAAKLQISRSIAFYTTFFQTTTGQSWSQVLSTAQTFVPQIQAKWPDYWDEIVGIAKGSGQSELSILALNVRTEVAFGQALTDGCTAASWLTGDASYLGQNWDWNVDQQENLVLLTIEPSDDNGKRNP